MKKYNKVTDMQVLKKYHDIQNFYDSKGVWLDYLSVSDLARELKTSKYQIQKAFKTLKEKGYLQIEKYPTLTEDYDNGLYTETIVILHTNVYMITQKGYDLFKVERKD